MSRNSKEVLKEMVEVFELVTEDSSAWNDKGVKSAAARIRKGTLQLTKLGKEFRSLSVAESKA